LLIVRKRAEHADASWPLESEARPRAGAPLPMRGIDWVRAVKWIVVALLAVWLLHLFIS
jgi:hypothetical protein